MGWRASVLGASGYAGGELLRLLGRHPNIEVAWVSAGANAGRPLGEVHPHLVSLADRSLLPADDPRLGDVDVLFLALPHGESAAVVERLAASGTVVIDLGADFRLDDAGSWEQFYGGSHAGSWPYGLPELPGARAALRDQRRIANPGCYPTAVALALAPLLAEGLVERQDLVIVAASGTSGAGRAAKPNLLGSEVMGDLSPYKVGGTHQHTPEIEQSLSDVAGQPVSMSFTPVLAPMPRGILATCTAKAKSGTTAAALRAAFAVYEGEAFVHLLSDGEWPQTGATLGSNSAHLQVTLDDHSGRIVVVSALDNLTKGAAGQALQNANIALGLDETTALPAIGVAP
jgi:N-acetyl-gamma-glutamyl-phosphate reductase